MTHCPVLDAVTDTASPAMPDRLASLLLVPEPAEPSPPDKTRHTDTSCLAHAPTAPARLDKPSPASHMPNHYDIPSPARTCRNCSCPPRPTAAVRDLSALTSHAFPHRNLPTPSDCPCRRQANPAQSETVHAPASQVVTHD